MEYHLLITGLGNPGEDYAGTRHNMGFAVADALIERAEARKSMRLTALTEDGDYRLWEMLLGGKGVLLAKPMTYMNRSGKAVAQILGRHGLVPEKLLVVHDELDLPLGRIKLKKGGGSAGNKGIESIDEHLSTPGYWRMRLGIGKPATRRAAADWVLTPFTEAEREAADQVTAQAVTGLEAFLRRGQQAAQQLLHPFLAPAAAVLDDGPDAAVADDETPSGVDS